MTDEQTKYLNDIVEYNSKINEIGDKIKKATTPEECNDFVNDVKKLYDLYVKLALNKLSRSEDAEVFYKGYKTIINYGKSKILYLKNKVSILSTKLDNFKNV